MLQAVYAAFARFRAHHVLSPGKRKDPEQASLPSQEAHAEADAVNMLRHVSNVVSQPSANSQATHLSSPQQFSEPENQQSETDQPESKKAASSPPGNGQPGELSPGLASLSFIKSANNAWPWLRYAQHNKQLCMANTPPFPPFANRSEQVCLASSDLLLTPCPGWHTSLLLLLLYNSMLHLAVTMSEWVLLLQQVKPPHNPRLIGSSGL